MPADIFESLRTLEDVAARALQDLRFADYIGADTEGTGIEFIKDGRHFLTGISVAWQEGEDYRSFYFPFRHKYGENLPMNYLWELVSILSQEGRNVIWHNSKFDYHALKTIGVDITTWKSRQWCTRMMLKYLNEEMPTGLDFASRVFLGDHKTDYLKKFADKVGWENIASYTMFEYACHDAELPLKLFWIYRPRLEKQGLWPNMIEAMDYRMLLFEMEQAGVGVDLEFCAEKEEQGKKVMDQMIHELGFDPAKRTQLGKFLLEDMDLPVIKWTYDKVTRQQKNPSFDKEAMEEYDRLLEAQGDSSAKRVLRFRGWFKAVTSLYVPMQRVISPDGLVRTNLNDEGTVTGRLSSDHPNLQQIPRSSEKEWNGDAKLAFNSGFGDEFRLIGFDYAQLELRLGAHYGQDEALLREFRLPDGDPFRAIALGIFKEFVPETRFKAKTFTYATGYGAKEGTVAARLGVSMKEVKQIYANYKESLPGYYRTSQICERQVREREYKGSGYIKYWTGRRRHVKISDVDRNPAIPFNSLLQGGGAELVKRAQLRAPNDNNCRQVLQVHDEIVFRIRRGMEETYFPQIVHAMTDFPEIRCPLKVEWKEWGAK